ACLCVVAGLVQRARLLDEGLALRRNRERRIEMSERSVKLFLGAREAACEQARGGIVRTARKAGLDLRARRRDLTIGKQHGREQLAEHGLTGLCAQSSFAEVFRLIAAAGIERGGGVANDVFGAVVHAGY